MRGYPTVSVIDPQWPSRGQILQLHPPVGLAIFVAIDANQLPGGIRFEGPNNDTERRGARLPYAGSARIIPDNWTPVTNKAPSIVDLDIAVVRNGEAAVSPPETNV